MPQSTLLNLPSSDDLAQQFAEDIQAGCIELGIDVPPVGKGTHFGLTATGAGNIGSVLIANQQLIDQDINPLTATGAALEDIRISDGLAEKPPVAARLSLQATVQGNATIPAGLAWQGPGGVRGTVDSLVSGSSTNVSVSTTVTDAGSSGNLKIGTFVNFINPPLNVQTQAVVTAVLSQGFDIESDEDKRNRIMLARQNPPAGGNWAQLVQVALSTVTNADGCWVYPALGGPGATKVILTRTNSSTPQDRTVDADGIDAVINAYKLQFPTEAQNIVVDTVINGPCFVGYQTQLATSGGAFWVDGTSSWPEYGCILSIVSGSTYLVNNLGIGGTTALSPGTTRSLAVWDPVAIAFTQVTATMVSGSFPGPYTVTISGTNSSLDGLYVCPWAPNINDYAKSLLKAMAAMGPGEYLASTSTHYLRSHRRPEVSESGPFVLNAIQAAAVQADFPSEILQLLLWGTTITPTMPTNNADKPRIIVPFAVAFYPGI
jgi:hypothetical protein